MRRQRIDTADTHTVESAGDFIRSLVELTAGMQHRHDDLKGRLVHLLMLVDGDSSAVVQDGDGVVLVDGHFDMCAIAGHRLVDRVVNRLVDQVVQTFLTDVAYIHGGALANGLKALKHLNVAR